MFNIGMNTLKPFFVGFLLGILVLATGAGLFAKTMYDNTLDNYGDETTGVVSLLEEAKDPVFQKDYIITGLILSDDFNAFLEEGVETGLWTEDFLIQFAADYSLPILLGHYADLIGAIASTDQAKEIAQIVSKLMDILVKVKLQLQVMGPEIQDLIEMLHDPATKDKAIAQIKEKVLTILENAGALDVFANIINKLDVVKFKVKGTVESFERLFKELKDPELRAEFTAKLKSFIQAKIESLGLTDKVADIKANIAANLEGVKAGVIDSVDGLVDGLSDKKDAIIAAIASGKADIIAQIEIAIDTIINSIVDSIDISGIKGKLAEAIIAHKGDIVAAIKDVVLSNVNVDAINKIIDGITDITKVEDVENDNWMFIPALKAYDDSMNLFDLPSDVYKQLNLLEPVINVLTLDIVYTYTPDDGNILNGNKANMDITAINVGKEGDSKTTNVLKTPVNLGGIIADTVNGFLPVLNNNI